MELQRHLLYAQTFVHPLTQIFHQHTTAAQFGIQGIPTPHPATLRLNGSPTKNFCKGLDHDTGTARAVLAAAVPETTQTGNFRPDNVHSIHPLFFTTFDAFPRALGYLSSAGK